MATPPPILPRLQVVYAWRTHLLGHCLLGPKERLWVGPAKGTDFATPELPGTPRRLAFLRPKAGGFRLTLAPGMTGWVETRVCGRKDVREILAQPGARRLFGSSVLREVDLWNGDAAVVTLDEATNLRLQVSFVEPPETIHPDSAHRREPFFFRVTGITSAVMGLAVLLLLVFSPEEAPETVEITQERFAKVIEPALLAPKIPEPKKAGKKKEKDKEAAMSKKMKDKEGKLGRQDAKGETVIPEGKKDIIREKVSQMGVLSVLGRAKAGGSGLGKLLQQDDSGEMEQAVTGLAGAQLAVGSGAGGLGTKGTGLGGGGTGFGRIQGSGNMDIGAGRGRSVRGSGLGQGKEKEVSVGVKTGDPDASGGLTREQVNRVVQAHVAALKYCYQKELQRKPHLTGKIELRWLIQPDGKTDRVKVAASTMGDAAVESCMERQVKNWRFPKASAPTLVQKYPFLFTGGV